MPIRVTLTGFASSKIGENYFVMTINQYDQIVNIINNFGPLPNTPLRKHQSVHIWVGKKWMDTIQHGETLQKCLDDLGAFQIECEIKKSRDSINITTYGLPVVL